MESKAHSNPRQKKHINLTTQHGQIIVFWKTKAFKDFQPSERFEKVKELKRCFNCLGEGHITKSCPSKGHCLKKGCKKRHHTVLHDYFLFSSPKEKKNDDNVDDKVEEAAIRGPSTVYLQVAPVILRAKKKMFRMYALLDSASMFTVLRKLVARKRNLKGKKGTISYGTIKKEDEDCEPIPLRRSHYQYPQLTEVPPSQ